ncbi:hypothetical protein [Erythrobacter sp. EC-HK427]|uniref:hypothetical protein n=1 Tax=Erythrobacter sp. EC-HK427 TaxID=2038396 RepID=UPI001256B478|nr:hypothetical protein [Erythrobacter sp. EC-HK427]VVT12165.1 exported hypothetical protein [Erythrobacter sp. EC-HK427]
MRLAVPILAMLAASCGADVPANSNASPTSSRAEVWEGPDPDGTVFGAPQVELDRAGRHGEPDERFALSAEQIAAIAALEVDGIDQQVSENLQRHWTPGFLGGQIDLNDDGRNEILVLSTMFCGSGGCSFRVYGDNQNGFSKISGSTIARPPITVLDSTTNGWRDLTIFVCGGGITPCHHVIMRFDGERYPLNPTMQPEIAADQLGVPILTEASPIHPVPMP